MTGWSMPIAAYESEAMQKYMRAPVAPFTAKVADIQSVSKDWSFVSEDDTFGPSTIGVTSFTKTWMIN